MVFQALEWAVVGFVVIAFSFLSFYRRALDLKGVLAAVIVGLLVYYLGGFSSFLVLVAAYVVMEWGTRYGRSITGKAHETRSIGNIAGNTFPALIALALNPGMLNAGFFGGLAAAMADTLSTEIGSLSGKRPVLITTFKEVEVGTDGGITLQGLVAGACGGLLMGVAFYFLSGKILALPLFAFVGLVGSMADSVLGAVFERRGILNNTHVNFLASAVGVALAGAMGTLLF